MLLRIKDALSEAAMGFLALAALGLGLAPLIFAVPPALESSFDAVEWLIVAMFATEYIVNLMASPNRFAFVRDPWRILDAAIILASLASFLPSISDELRSTLALRVLRLFRALLFGVRAGHAVMQPALPPSRGVPLGPPEATRLAPADATPQRAEWSGLLHWVASPTGDWMHVSNMPFDRLHEIAAAARVPHVMVEAAMHESSYPRLLSGDRWSALSLSVPSQADLLRRDPVLLLVREAGLLSVGLHPIRLQEPPASFEEVPWGTRCALDLVRRVVLRNEELAAGLEREARTLEALPADESPESFFETTFRLKRALAMAMGDLWRLRAILEMLSDGRRGLPGLTQRAREEIRLLSDDADFLYETLDHTREAVLSLIDLHINMASHDTNRFMRLVAIMSTLALIPAITGGLLGMNLGDSPWPVTLGQIAFITLMLMLAVLYTFMAKGWLK